MSRYLWRPATESDGVQIQTIWGFMQSLNEWKDNYLQHVGVPPNFPSDWDFISCVTACELPPLLIIVIISVYSVETLRLLCFFKIIAMVGFDGWLFHR